MHPIAQALSDISGEGPQAADKLLPLVYEELRRVAAQRLAQEPFAQSLEATALVHEAYLRLIGPANADGFEGRNHFFAAAAEAMRRILVDHARCRDSLKRGGDQCRRELDQERLPAPQRDVDVLALDEALDELAARDQPAAELVKLRYFAGMTVAQAAEVLGVSERTAERMWVFARSFLYRAMRQGEI